MDRAKEITATGYSGNLMSFTPDYNEQQVAEAFSKQAPVFDSIYGSDLIVQYKRQRVREHLSRFLPAHSSVLELNAGTGEDSCWLASNGHMVHATDISGSMLEQLRKKASANGLGQLIHSEQRSFTDLSNLNNRGPFDLIFSNFAGLNCTDKLNNVLASFHHLVKAGGYVTLVILPKFCLWETLLLFRGQFKTAFRRFSGKKGAQAHIGGQHFKCWYYNPGFIRSCLKDKFELCALEGLCTVVPPSYIEKFGTKHPRLFAWLKKRESYFKSKWPFRSIGDYYIITLRKLG
jgi:ubiquinone/menaquinone biosynthesis C-methylase UbiE